MSASLDLVRREITAHGLDTVEVWDQAGRNLVAEANGGQGDALLDQLAANLQGAYRVEAFRAEDVTASGGLKKGARAFRWVVNFGQPVGALSLPAGGDRPSWSEVLDLKLQLQEKVLRDELGEKDGGALDRIASLLEKVLTGGQAAPAPAPATAAAAPAGGAEGELPAEVLQAARNVALLYKQDPQAFARYAPLLAGMVNPTPAADET